MTYYRAWRDETMQGVNTELTDENQMNMNDIPYGIDIVNVFSFVPEGEEEQAEPFFEKLEDEYVPNLHKRGVKLTKAIDYSELLEIDYEGDFPTEEEFDQFAKELLDEHVYAYDLDGLDIDMEVDPSKEEVKISDGVIKALAKYIGPKGEEDTVFVYDTNASNLAPFENVADYFTYLGYQQYGSDTERTEDAMADYEELIGKDRFMPGLAFPEEQDDNRWYDAREPYEESNMKELSQYVQENQLHGMFVYALDRDGRTYEEDDLNHIKKTNFLWTKTAILETKGYSVDDAKQFAIHHWRRKNDLEEDQEDETIEKIKESDTIYDVNKVLLGSSDNFEEDGLSIEYDPIYEEKLMEKE
ncbi:endoglycosidase [Tetragenococcus halophilus]|nr:endoglycosidase [Tetragenococcus halophilus]MCO8295596.1 endoglycosidase [Tetragenococcus halophilus]